MPISMKKAGSTCFADKTETGNKIMIGLNWGMDQNSQVDLDVSAFLLGRNRKLLSDDHLIFYNNLQSPDMSVQHTGDNRSGEEEWDEGGDNEMILINLDDVDSRVTEIFITVSIYDGIPRAHHFGMLSGAYVRILDVDKDQEILRYNLGEKNPTDNALVFGRLLREKGEWSFEPVGSGSTRELQGYVDIFV